MSNDRPIEDHDLGLHHDLQVMASRTLQRRRLLSLFGSGAAAAAVTACGGGGSSSGTSGTTTTATTGTTTTTTTGATGTTTTTATSSTACIANPTETNGPYPADGTNSVNGTISNILTATGVVRSDITTSFNGLSGTATGVPLVLTIKLVNTNAGCAALEGYAIYVWHCDSQGRYSLYSSAIQNQNYLRGVQVTNANGEVTFTTLYPACYSGRWPHIHFEVFPSLATATAQGNAALTSQFAMPAAINTVVFNGSSAYAASVANYASISLTSDAVFGDDTSAQIAAMTPTLAGSVANGFTGTVTVGIAR